MSAVSAFQLQKEVNPLERHNLILAALTMLFLSTVQASQCKELNK